MSSSHLDHNAKRVTMYP